MRKLAPAIALLTWALVGFAAAAATKPKAPAAPKFYASFYAVGPSAPRANADVLQPGIALVRARGGETITFEFLDQNLNDSQQVLAGFRITAHSKSGKGAVLVHSVSLSPRDEPAELKALEGTVRPGKRAHMVLSRPVPTSSVTFQLEALGADDASATIGLFFTQAGKYKYRVTEDYVNPPAGSGGEDGGNDNGGGTTYRDECFSSPGHFGCSDRGPGSLYDQHGCEANPGSINCQGG